MALWRSGYAAVCKTAYTGSIPVGASTTFRHRNVPRVNGASILGPGGGIGIRVRLKIEWGNPYGFKSRPGYQICY